MRTFLILIFFSVLASLTVGQDGPPPTKANKRPTNSSERIPEPFDNSSKEEMKKCVTFNTTKGKIVLEMFPFTAPETVRNFLNLTAIKAYDGSFFNRIVPGFVIQGGNLFAVKGVDKKILERSLRKIPDEPNLVKHTRGILSMARGEEPNSASSDFFILLRAASTLDEKFAAFGRVTEGMDVVEIINKMPVEEEIPKEPVAIATTSIDKCVVKPEDATKIDDLPRFSLKGKTKSVEKTTFYAKGKEKDWKKAKNRKGSKMTSFGVNGNFLSIVFFDKEGKELRIRTSSGTIWGERADGTAEFVEKNSAGEILETVKKKRTSKSTYEYQTLDSSGKLKIKGVVETDDIGRIMKQTFERYSENGAVKNTVTKEVTYDPYGFVETEKVSDDNGKVLTFFKYDYRGFDDEGNWTERWVLDSETAEKPVRVEVRKLKYF